MPEATRRSGSGGPRDPIRVFGVDDHPGVLEGLSQIVADQEDLIWTGEARSIADAQAKIAALLPDVVVMDSRLKGESGLDLCAWVHREFADVRVLMLTGSTDETLLFRALTVGASGFLVKQARGRDILDAIRSIHAGGVVWDPRMGQAVLAHFRQIGSTLNASDRLEMFRDRLKQLYNGMTAIAGVRTVQEMLQRVVSLSREITQARYGALAVLQPDESISQFIADGLTPDEMKRMGSLPRGRGLLGEVIRSRRPLRVDDISRHPHFHGWPVGHPRMKTFLGMPMLFQGEVVGHLYVTDKQGGEPFSGEDEELLGLLAGLAAVLIKNLRLNDDVERLAVVEERQRIGMNLHDGTLQTIYSVLLGLDAILGDLPDDTRAHRTVNQLAERLREATDDIRRYVLDLKSELRPLMASIQEIARDLGIGDLVRLHSSDLSYSLLPPDAVEQLVRFTQEALSNVVRHARASRVDITWRRVGDEYQLLIEDDGVGFDTAKPSPPGHHGRRHLEERARRAGGHVTVQSRPHEGTRVVVTGLMPVK